MEPLMLGTSTAATKLAGALYSALTEAAKSKWKEIRNEQRVGQMATRLNSLRLVKTIWEPDKPVDLASFYVPGHVYVGNDRKTLDKLSDLPRSRHLTIQGTVGLGKSMLMRWLAWREVGFGQRVPVFLELRKVKSGEGLLRSVLEELDVLGLYAEMELFECLANQGKLVLLLDGFDEISPEVSFDIAAEVERIARRIPQLPIIVSTRPGSSACHLQGFTVCSLSLLEGSEYVGVLRKIEPDQSAVARILSALKERGSPIEYLLSTPLMVALLVLKFRADYEVPENELAFYEGLFDLLSRRHDRSKGGFQRIRKSALSNHAMNEVFDAFSYLTRRDNLNSFTHRQACDVAHRALRHSGISADAEALIDDIAGITCLLLFDSGEGRFVHRSIQEFHAACFVSRLPDEVAQKFYEYLLKDWTSWQQEVRFLPMLDRARFTEHFEIPIVRRFCDEFEGSTSDDDIYRRVLDVFGDMKVGFDSMLRVGSLGWVGSSCEHNWFGEGFFACLPPFLANIRERLTPGLNDEEESGLGWAPSLRTLSASVSRREDFMPLVEFVRAQRRRLAVAEKFVSERYNAQGLLPAKSTQA